MPDKNSAADQTKPSPAPSSRGRPLVTFPLFMDGNNEEYLEIFAANRITTNLELYRECFTNYSLFRSSRELFSYASIENRILSALKCNAKSNTYKLIEDFAVYLVQKIDPEATVPPLDIPEVDGENSQPLQSLGADATTDRLPPETDADIKRSEEAAAELSRPFRKQKIINMVLYGGGMHFRQPNLIRRSRSKGQAHQAPKLT